jgi:phosphoglycerate dehydrogenase-like enzyme
MDIAIDLCLDLKLYSIPNSFVQEINRRFPGVNIIYVDESKLKFQDLKNVVIYFGNRLSPDIYDLMPKLEWIHFGSAGVDRLRKIALRRDIIVTNSKGIMSRSVAVHAFSMILYFARGLNLIANSMEKSMLTRKDYDKEFENITDLCGEKIAIFGRGGVGIFLHRALTNLNVGVDFFGRDDLATLCIDEMNQYNFVVNILPLDNKSENFFNRFFFNAMSKDAVFINVGRGETVVEADLIDAVRNTKIRGVGLDVFCNEPLDPKSELNHLDNVLLTPHVAGLFNNYWKLEEELFLFNLDKFNSNVNQQMRNIVSTTKNA